MNNIEQILPVTKPYIKSYEDMRLLGQQFLSTQNIVFTGLVRDLEKDLEKNTAKIVNFAQKLPLKFKYRFRNSKFLLKKAMQNILPDEILKKPKQGFALPMTKWLKTWEPNKNNVAGLSEDFFSKKLLAHKKGKKDNRLFLWNYIALNSHVNLLNRKTF
jgi:asparagine synthetase B (glutamine-hydrolysing)